MRFKSFTALVALTIGGMLGFGAASANATVVDGVNLTPGLSIQVTDLLQNAPSKVGDTLTAVGQVTSFNGSNSFCAGCQLTFVASGFTVTQANGPVGSPTGLGFTGGTVNIYVLPGNSFNTFTQHNLNDAITAATSGTLFLQLSGHTSSFASAAISGDFSLISFGSLTGADTQGATAQGTLDVVKGDAAAYFDTNTINDSLGGHADFSLSGGVNITSVSDADRAGGIIFRGSDNIQGSVKIPEPGTLALLGSALFGLGVVTRRRRAKA